MMYVVNKTVRFLLNTSFVRAVIPAKRLEDELKASKLAADVAKLAKMEFIANMSHDIRTPLTGIIGMSTILEERTSDSEEKQYAHWIKESGKQLLGLLNGILDVVSAENVHDTDLLHETFDLHRSIQHLAELELPAVKLKNLKLFINISDDVPRYIVSDPIKLHRILLNLVGNSIKFTKKGQIGIHVTLLRRLKDAVKVRFSVLDTGIGIPKELQSKVFERFFRVNPSYKGVYKGYGIGLHVAQHDVNLLGGEIKLSSQVNRGTTFYFELVLKIGQAKNIKDSTMYRESQEHNQTKTNNLPLPNLLLIEDSPIALKMLEIASCNMGCSFESAENALIALELIKTQSFDLIITDIELPSMNGVDLASNIRSWEKVSNQKKTPIIGLTAYTMGTETEKCLQAGMNKILVKPATFKLIQSVVEEFIYNKKNEPSDEELKTAGLPPKEDLLKLTSFPLLDLEKGLVLLGNEDVLKEMITLMIQQSLEEDVQKIKQAYAQNDWNTIQTLAHKLKGGADYCGLIQLKMACEYLERYQKQGYTPLLEPLYHQMLHTIESTKDSVKIWLSQYEH